MKQKILDLDTILIIHDDPIFARCMNTVLETIPSFGSASVRCCFSSEDIEELIKDFDGKNQIELVIVQAEFGKGERYKRKGVELTESLRRNWRLLAPVVVLSLDARERVAQKYPIAGEKVPGTCFLKVPFRLEELGNIIISAEKLSLEQLKDVVANYCRLDEFLEGILHNINNAVRADKIETAKDGYNELKRYITDFLPGRFDKELKETKELFASDKDTLSSFFFSLLDEIKALEQKPDLKKSDEEIRRREELEEKFARIPAPEGYEFILIVDDDRYDIACVEKLKEKGYGVEVVDSRREALESINIDPPDVLLCDLRLEGNSQIGLYVAQKALSTPQVKSVIMISADEIDKDKIPTGVEVCEGRDKFNTKLIHALICSQAKE